VTSLRSPKNTPRVDRVTAADRAKRRDIGFERARAAEHALGVAAEPGVERHERGRARVRDANAVQVHALVVLGPVPGERCERSRIRTIEDHAAPADFILDERVHRSATFYPGSVNPTPSP
jgi:hypothetical protein